jgi:hypothetical protein
LKQKLERRKKEGTKLAFSKAVETQTSLTSTELRQPLAFNSGRLCFVQTTLSHFPRCTPLETEIQATLRPKPRAQTVAAPNPNTASYRYSNSN